MGCMMVQFLAMTLLKTINKESLSSLSTRSRSSLRMDFVSITLQWLKGNGRPPTQQEKVAQKKKLRNNMERRSERFIAERVTVSQQTVVTIK